MGQISKPNEIKVEVLCANLFIKLVKEAYSFGKGNYIKRGCINFRDFLSNWRVRLLFDGNLFIFQE